MNSGSHNRYVRLLKYGTRILCVLLTFTAVLAQALPDDRDQPIHITADKAQRDEKKGVTIYSGNVHLVQGSLELEAEKLTIFHTSQDAEEIIAEGHPAKMRQQPEMNKAIVDAHANIIKYYRTEERVHLQTDARIEQDGAVVAGDSIEYLIAKQLITAESDKTRQGTKVVVVIPPSLQQKEEGSGTTQSE